MRSLVALIWLALLGAMGPALAAKNQNPFVGSLPTLCRDMTSALLASPQLKPILDKSPVAEAVICHCVEKGIQEDPTLRQLFGPDPKVLLKRFTEAQLRPYFKGKMMSIEMACVAPELDRATEALAPKK